MTNPKLALIPSAYKVSKVYSPLPTNGDGDFTFTRNSVATRVNKDGLIEEVAIDTPRLDYSDGGCPSLLLEPQRTNNILNSESLSNASWQKFNSGLASAPIITDNYAISPSGEINASRLQMSLGGGTTTNDRIFIRQSLTSQSDYHFSVYLKSTNGGEQKLNWHYGSDDFLITVTDEWQRFELPRSGNATVWVGLGLRGNLVSAIGIDHSVDILVYGFQVEQGSYATSYIPTNGAIATRVADECTDSGNADLFNDNEGVLFIETKAFADLDDNRYMSISDGASTPYTNHIIFQYRTDGDFRVYVGGLNSSNIAFLVSSIDLSENHKIAFQYKLNDNKLFINGVEQSPYVSFVETTLSGLNDLSFSLNNGNSFIWRASVKDLRYYDKVLTDAELTELTTL